MKRQVAIVHYNTPELTQATILSIRKHGGMDWPVTVLDNSDRRPFKPDTPLGDVTIVDNTHGQLIDFDKELENFPNRCKYLCCFGSAKHMMSVQKLWELLPGGFILMDSDIVLTRPVDFLWDEQFAACGSVQRFAGSGRPESDRLLPMLCYLNVPLLVKNGARYFDPVRNFGLHSNDKKDPLNWYDTGASLLEDIRKTKPQLVARIYHNLLDYYDHYRNASWGSTDINHQRWWVDMKYMHWQLTDDERKQLEAVTPKHEVDEKKEKKTRKPRKKKENG